MLSFIAGVFIGGFLGVTVMCCAIVAGDADRAMERGFEHENDAEL